MKMRQSKRAESAGSASVLLAIIAILIILFIILVPPQERARILEESGNTSTTVSNVPQTVLLKTSPGRIDYMDLLEVEHPLPVVNLFSKTDAKVIAKQNVVYTKRGIFSNRPAELNFSLADPEHSQNILLNYRLKSAKGDLIIKLNGQEIYRGSASDFAPLTLSNIDYQNQLQFSLSSPGLAFWSTHEAILENVQIVADIQDLSTRFAEHTFLLSDIEKKNLESIRLRFQPTCNMQTAGKLVITVNENEVYNGLPDCEVSMVPIEFSEALVSKGENKISFLSERGNYVLSHVHIKSELKEIEYPTYYFELSREQQQAIESGQLKLRLQFDFVDVVLSKFGDITFNGHLKHFDTKEVSYAIDLSSDAQVGTNSLKIVPKKTLEIRQLKVDLVR